MSLSALPLLDLVPTIAHETLVTWGARLGAFVVLRLGILWWIPRVVRHYQRTYFQEVVLDDLLPIGPGLLVLALAALSAWVAGGTPLAAPAVALMGVALVGAVWADLRFRVIPDRFQIAGALGAVAFIALRVQAAPDAWQTLLVDAATGAGYALALYLLGWIYTRVRKRDAMGLGDIKLLAWLGLAIGGDALLVVFYATCAAAVLALPLWLLRRRSLETTLAFAPYIALGVTFHLVTLALTTSTL